jgi:hypothetical protein
MVKVGDIICVKGWTSSAPRQRLQVLAVRDGYVWCRAEWPKGSNAFGGTHYSFALDQIEAASRPSSLEKLKAANGRLSP